MRDDIGVKSESAKRGQPRISGKERPEIRDSPRFAEYASLQCRADSDGLAGFGGEGLFLAGVEIKQAQICEAGEKKAVQVHGFQDELLV